MRATPTQNREVFDTIRTHLLTQGTRCTGENGMCLYLDPTTGNRCAVGCLIDPSHYSPTLEDQTACDPQVQRAVDASLGFSPHSEMLSDLQSLHDDTDPSDWDYELTMLEESHIQRGIMTR